MKLPAAIFCALIVAHAARAAPTSSGLAPANGIKLYFEDYGKKEGVPLVLLHGGGSTIESNFAKVIPILAKNRRVIAIEEQAHGRSSDRAAPVRFESSADDVAAALDYLKVEKADILGFSNGGSVALQVTLRHPKKVQKLVFASSMTKRSAAPDQFWAFMKKASLEQMPEGLKEAFLKVNPDRAKLKIMHDKDAERMNSFQDVPDEQLKTIKAPTLILSGDRDLAKPEHMVELSKLIPNSRLLILPSGHGDYLGEVTTKPAPRFPELAMGLIEQFLDAP